MTIGTGYADGMAMFTGVGLDYYSPHWYDYMSGGTYCMICQDASYYQQLYGINKPIVVGEMFSGTSTTTPYSSAYRFDYFYNHGYAGAWAWSLFPSHTNDGLVIDLAAEGTFSAKHPNVGP